MQKKDEKAIFMLKNFRLSVKCITNALQIGLISMEIFVSTYDTQPKRRKGNFQSVKSLAQHKTPIPIETFVAIASGPKQSKEKGTFLDRKTFRSI